VPRRDDRLDKHIGEMLDDVVDRLGAADNTFMQYSTDNGAQAPITVLSPAAHGRRQADIPPHGCHRRPGDAR